MLQAGCIYLGIIIPCPETFHPLHLPRRFITPCPTTNAISTKVYPKHPAWLTFPLPLPQTSLQIWSLPDPSPRSAWSLGRLSPLLAWIKVTYFSWGRLSSFCLGPSCTLHSWCRNREGARHSSHSLSLSLPLIVFPFPGVWEREHPRAHFSARAQVPLGGAQSLREPCKPCAKALLMLCVPPGLGSTPFLSLSPRRPLE